MPAGAAPDPEVPSSWVEGIWVLLDSPTASAVAVLVAAVLAWFGVKRQIEDARQARGEQARLDREARAEQAELDRQSRIDQDALDREARREETERERGSEARQRWWTMASILWENAASMPAERVWDAVKAMDSEDLAKEQATMLDLILNRALDAEVERPGVR
ncbi:hypothetical protein BJF86_13375 [Serinicoccus sp. CNJ-927]|uniref:hypothetical protein n=1 Tax=Serinicoccus sp. CNJ-927 TaxID=1904970 RepID=UPI00095E147C|nr:hypothetical protein [Serinicoccus sp. CNJ-927]OLT43945.1 hypothetical protein BJF86_13375 [Serinicoccus sp. CNJ-927]